VCHCERRQPGSTPGLDVLQRNRCAPTHLRNDSVGLMQSRMYGITASIAQTLPFSLHAFDRLPRILHPLPIQFAASRSLPD